MSAVTLADVAKHASVSSSTVSLVINNREGVHAQTRQRVFEAIDELGYQPRRHKSDAPESPTRHVAIIYPLLSMLPGGSVVRSRGRGLEVICQEQGEHLSGFSHHQHKVLQVLRRQLKAHQHTFSILSGMEHVDHDPIFKAMVEDGDIDGAIFIKVVEADGYADLLLERGIPVVAPMQYCPWAPYSSVGLDGYAAGVEVARQYARQGHECVGVLGIGPQRRHIAERVRGFVDAAEAAGLCVGVKLDMTSRDGDLEALEPSYEGVAEELIQHGVTALFCVMESLAIGCIDALNERGIRVPEQVEVMGVDDIRLESKRGQVLSSVGYGVEEIGMLSVNAMLQLMDETSSVKRLAVALEPKLMHYDTTRPGSSAMGGTGNRKIGRVGQGAIAP